MHDLFLNFLAGKLARDRKEGERGKDGLKVKVQVNVVTVKVKVVKEVTEW
jgi:hypothetical protein